MMKILLSAFACDPTQGSEFGNGWNWAIGLANKGFEVHCLTQEVSKSNIQSVPKPANLFFHYIKLPFGLDSLYSFSQPTMYIHYMSWQWLAYKRARLLHENIGFNIVHHVTWGSLQLGSFLYKIPAPFIFGPVGGGQISPIAFREYFGKSWEVEQKREKVSDLLLRYNPACKSMLKKAKAVWVSNPDTAELAIAQGVSGVNYTLDAALPADFFPKDFNPKVPQPRKLSLLWVGRFLPRKGLLLLVEVMERLKDYPDITLTVVGDGEQKPDFLEAIKEKGLKKSVFWMGKVPFEKVREYYASHDVFFFTSLRDSCPAQLIEAMAFGMPVVTLNLHGQAIIVNDSTGFRCDCDTPEEAVKELTIAILTLFNNPEVVSTMSEAAHQFALQQTWDHKIDTIVKKSYLPKI